MQGYKDLLTKLVKTISLHSLEDSCPDLNKISLVIKRKMAAIATALLSNVFGNSEAEIALTPWWDIFEDYCVYGLIMLGKHQINIYFMYKKYA